jgi:hypothetical protein
MQTTPNYQLFIDETGDPDLESPKPYILSGCSIEDFRREELKNYADHIKYKYWGRTDVIFHSKEIGYAENEFKILNDKKLRKDFEKDLLTFLEESQYKLFFVVLDKAKAKEQSWNNEKAMHKTAGAMFRNFILALKASEATGNILIEPSYFEKDAVYLKAFNYFRAPKSDLKEEFNIEYKEVQNTLTSLSFVTKKNHDVEVQIADLMAYAAWQTVKPFNKSAIDSYEKNIAKVLKQKLFKLNYKHKGTRTEVYKAIKPLQALPD